MTGVSRPWSDWFGVERSTEGLTRWNLGRRGTSSSPVSSPTTLSFFYPSPTPPVLSGVRRVVLSSLSEVQSAGVSPSGFLAGESARPWFRAPVRVSGRVRDRPGSGTLLSPVTVLQGLTPSFLTPTRPCGGTGPLGEFDATTLVLHPYKGYDGASRGLSPRRTSSRFWSMSAGTSRTRGALTRGASADRGGPS